MTDNFNVTAHRILGNSKEATTWVRQSTLADNDKELLLKFIARFPTLTFFKEDQELLDHVEQREQVKLPRWFRNQRQTLAFIAPKLGVRFDDFDHLGPRSDTMERIWYEFDLTGYVNQEQRELFLDQATSFTIGQWPLTDRSFLAINMADENDERIHEFCAEDLLDNVYEGVPAKDSVFPAYDSYASMLAHILDVKDVSGNVTTAVTS